MKKSIRGIASLTVILAMCFSLYGCGTKSNADKSDKSASQPVKLTMYTGNCTNFTPGVQDDPVSKEIEKQTGVTMDVTSADSIGDYNSKLDALIASGDLPDIVYIPNEKCDTAIKAGAIMPLDDLIESNGKDIKKDMDFRLKYSRKFKSMNNGKLYFIPLYGGNSDPTSIGTTAYIRWDLYKQLGYPELNTYEDLLPVLKQMQDRWPTTADGKKTYGVSGFFGDSAGWAEWPLTYPLSLLYGYRCDRHLYVNSSTNELLGCTITDMNSPFIRSLKWYNKANQLGILDPECFTMKTDQYQEKLKAGRIYFTPASWWAADVSTSLEAGGHPEQGMMPIAPPKDDKRIYKNADEKYTAGAWCYAISKNCKHPDKAMGLLNFFCTKEGTELLYNGVKGKDWDVVNGTPQLKPDVINGILHDKDYSLKSGICKYSAALAGYQDGVKDEKYPNCYVNFSLNSDFIKASATAICVKDFNDHFKVTCPGELYEKMIPDNKSYAEVVTGCIPSTPDELNKTAVNIDNYIHNNVVKVILAKNDDEFNTQLKKLIDDVNKMGMQDVYNWEKSEYEKAKTTITSLEK